MNITLPPSRDLPPGRHAEIRAAVLTAATSGQTPRWVAPLVTAGAALAVVGAVAWVAPWSGTGGGVTAADQPRPVETTQVASTAAGPVVDEPAPSIAGLTADEVADIEQGCRDVTFPDVKFTLLAVHTDAAGKLAVLGGTDVGGREYMIDCTLDFSPDMPYNGGGGVVDAFVPPVSIDLVERTVGGDVPGGKPEYKGKPGAEEYAGRISPDVAKVTVTQDGTTVEATLGDGAYLTRILRPADWVMPETPSSPIVRAYDVDGTLLAEI